MLLLYRTAKYVKEARFGLDMQDAVPCIHSLTVMHRIMAAATEALVHRTAEK